MGFVVKAKPRPIYSRKWLRINWIGGWVDRRAVLDGCEKSRTRPWFDPRTIQLVENRYTDYASSLYRTIIGTSEPVPWRLSGCILRFILMPPTDNASRRVNLIFMSVRSYVCSRTGRCYFRTRQIMAHSIASQCPWSSVAIYIYIYIYVGHFLRM
jgi:hypothetical protein